MSKAVKLLVLVAVCGAAAGVVRFALVPASATADTDELSRLFRPALPLIEEALGYPFARAPEFRLVPAAELDKHPGWESKGFLRWRFPGLPPEAATAAYQQTHQLDCAATAARHVEGTDIIVVAPDKLAQMARWEPSLQELSSPACLQLVLVHETVRLALEQRYHLLDRAYDPHSLEEFQIYQALREGQAQWVTRQVAQRLGSERYFPLLAERWQHVPDRSVDARLRTVSQTALQQKHWAYTRGLAFFDAVRQQGRGVAVDQVFARPPQRLEEVEQPALYLQTLQDRRTDLRALFTRLETALPFPGWQSSQQPWTPSLLKQVAVTLEVTKRVEALLPHWVEGRSLIWLNPKDASEYVALSLVCLDGPQAARSYYGLAVDIQRQRDGWLARTLGQHTHIEASKFVSVRLAGTAEAIQNNKILQTGSADSRLAMTMILARCGSSVVEIHWNGVPVNLPWAEHAIQCLAQENGTD